MKFKNVSIVSTSNGLISIFCDHECRGTNLYHEYFFLNKEHKLVAHFESTEALHVEQLSKEVEDIFHLSVTTWDKNKSKEKNIIIKVNPDLTYEVLHNIENYESGIEDGAFAIKKNGLWGFMDAYGNEFIKPQYENYASFSNGLAGVYKDGKWGFINKQNELIIPYKYEFPENGSCFFVEYENKLYVSVMKNGKWGVIDNNDNLIIPFIYDDLGYANKIIYAKKDDKYGFIDLKNNVVVPFEYDNYEEDFQNFCELTDYHLIAKDDLVGLIDNTAKFVIPIEYKSLVVSNDKTIVAKKQNDKYILIDFKNKQLSDEFDYINAFPNEGFYVVLNFVNKRKMKGYINETGELVIPLKYWLTRDFEGGIAVAETHDFKAEVLNKKGEVLYSGDHGDIFNIGYGCILAENNNGGYEIIRLT
ncbi:WG repeat-containing protein [bacterium]|nr:WG repeat-containing protein [bacterium]